MPRMRAKPASHSASLGLCQVWAKQAASRPTFAQGLLGPSRANSGTWLLRLAHGHTLA